MTTYIRAHGKRLRWTVATLKEAGIDVERVDPGLNGNYYISVAAAADAVDRALANMEGYQKRKPRKALDLRLFDLLVVAGVAVAGIVALVTPLGAGVVLAMMVFGRWAFGQMHEPAAELWKLGGKWRLSSIVGVIVVLLMFVAFLASAGYMAAAEIAGGNSALKLLGG